MMCESIVVNVKQLRFAGALVFLALLVFYPPDALAEERRNIRFQRISLETGLSQDVITTIFQDRYGFIWIGTQEGLNRFDGRDFEIFRRDPDVPGSLSNDSIWALYEDADGVMWIGTDGGGLNRYDPHTNAFEHFLHDPENPQSLSGNCVRTVTGDGSGGLWIGTVESGLNHLDPRTGIWKCFRHDKKDVTSLSNDRIRCLYRDRSGRLWIGTDGGGINKLKDDGSGFLRLMHDNRHPASLCNNFVRSIIEDLKGQIWIGTYEGGLDRLDPASGLCTHFRHDPNDSGSLSDNVIRAVYEGRDGIIWVATDRGLCEWRPESECFVCYQYDPANPMSLSDNRTITIFQDEGKVLWVGTYSGLNKWSPITGNFLHYKMEPGNPSGLSSNIIQAFAEDLDGNLWIGTYDGGLSCYNRFSERYLVYRNDPDDPDSLADDRVMSLLVDSEGVLWIGTFDDGLDRFDSQDGTFTHYRSRRGFPNSLSSNGVTSIFEDSRDVLWIGTYGGGLNRFDRSTESFRHYQNRNIGDPRSSRDNCIVKIVEGRAGELWIGTDGGGLIRFDPDNGTFTPFRHETSDPTSLSSDKVLEIYIDSQGVMWIGTYGGGLNRWDPADRTAGRGRFKRYLKQEGLFSSVIYGILEDDQQRLWLSTNRGLSRFDPRGETFRLYDTTHGLQSNEFNSGASFKSAEGQMFFGGSNGFNAFVPKNICDNFHVPKVQLTKFLKFNQEVDLGKPLWLTDRIELNYRDYLIAFEVAVLDFTAPENNRFMYKLEGLDKDWIDLGNLNRITLTNIGSGDYTLRVKAANNDGVWSKDGVSLGLRMVPPPWKTWWAYCIYGIALAGAIFLAHFLRVRRIEARQAAVESALVESQTLLKMLNRLSKTDISALSLTQIIQLVLDKISEHFQNLRISYARIDHNKQLTIVYSREPAGRSSLRGQRIAFDHAPEYVKAVENNTSIIVGDVAQDTRIAAVAQSLLKLDIGAFVHLPMQHSAQRLGALCFDAPRPRRWQGHEIINMTEASQYLTVVIQNALINEGRRRVEDQMKASLKEKEAMLKEIHHRVKNNLQVIHSLLNLQTHTLKEERSKEIFEVTQTRIRSMSLIHDQLYQSGNMARVSVKEHAETLVSSLYRSYCVDTQAIHVHFDIDNISLDVEKAIPCGLILNELVSNSFKYAFPSGRQGKIEITLTSEENGAAHTLRVADDGVGFPEELDFHNTESMGMQLVTIFTEQLEGTIKLNREKGTEFVITFTG